MEWNFSYSGRTVLITEVTGTVIDSSTWVETEVRGESYGGGGHLYEGTGTIYAPQMSIWSQTTQRGRAFVKCDDGRERTLETTADIPVRVGSRVRMIFETYNGRKALIDVENENTGARWIEPGYSDKIRFPSYVSMMVAGFFTLQLGLFALFFPSVFGNTLTNLLVVFSPWLIWYIYYRRKQRRVRQAYADIKRFWDERAIRVAGAKAS